MSEFWSDKRVVVSGGAGFLGSFVVEGLRGRGCENVFVPRSAEYDLTTTKACEQLYTETTPDILIHLAAEVGGIGANRKRPGRFFYANMTMGLNLIEEGRKYNQLKKFLQVGTVCAYPKFAPVPFREQDLWDGYPEETNAPYGIAKKALLVMLQSYRDEYGFPGVYLLPVNLYGPKDNFDLETSHVIPAMIRKFIQAREAGDSEVLLWGTGKPSREFLYVEDAAEGILLAAERYEGAEPINLGTGREIRISELAELIAQLCNYKGSIVWDSSQPDGQPRRCLDTTKAKEQFGFAAKTPFEEGLRRTIAWFENSRLLPSPKANKSGRFGVHPLVRGMDIDDPRTTHLRKQLIKAKPFLRLIYEEWYRFLIRELPAGKEPVLEIGSGAGFLKELMPELISSEVFHCPGVDLLLDAHRLPFSDASLRAIVMTDVLHHLITPTRFFEVAGRCVKPDGVLAMIEPWVTPWSRIIYKHLHHEPFDPETPIWELPSGGPLSTANGALAWIIFQRDRERFEREHPEWQIRHIEPVMPFRYLLSGGVSLRSLMPGWSFGFWRQMEDSLSRWMATWGMFAQIVLVRK